MREMKLNYSTSLVTFIYIHIIISITPIISYETETDNSNWQPPPSPASTTLPLSESASSSSLSSTSSSSSPSHSQQLPPTTTNHGNVNSYQISTENKKVFDEQVKSQLLKVLGLNKVPNNKPNINNKAYVPRAMLEEYKRIRETVREIIPEDRDFYGKIPIDDLEQNHEPVWGENQNQLNNQDIVVDMGQDNEASRRLHVKRSAKHSIFVEAQSEPEDVSPALEHLLPPYSSSPGKPKQFISVHLKFNLSQEYYDKPMEADDLGSAELNLFRERVHNKARFQKVYIIQITDYDKHNDPITKIHDSRRIDTEDLSPLKFNVYEIIKYWLLNPTKNYGIIVRVTNDDTNYKQKQVSNASTIAEDDDNNNSNTTNNTASNESTVVEHVRLKRQFQSVSESDESWLRKRPSIIITSSDSQDDQNIGTRVARSSATSSSSTTATTTKSGAPNQRVRTKSKPTRQTDKCSMRNLEINFDEMGWSNWIIAPGAYFANYCAGDCSFPLIDQQNATNHAIIQSIFHSVGRLTPRSCCAPTKLSSMAVLYQLDGSVHMRYYDDMVVESCGCR